MPSRSCGPSDWLSLRQQKKDSHKGDNGRLLIAAGSLQYHGSLILAILAATRFCDLVYVYCDKGNKALVQRLKQTTPNIIVLGDESALRQFLPRIDAILAGPGWRVDAKNRSLLARLLKTKKPVILDATALRMLKPKDLRPHAPGVCSHVLITPHAGEFRSLFGAAPNERTVRAMSKKFGCTILAKGPVDYIASPSSLKHNTIHHAGMTKGGTGDVLAGLAGALVAHELGAGAGARDDAVLFRVACAAAYLNGLAGVRLAKKMGAHYSSADLADELPLAARSIEKR